MKKPMFGGTASADPVSTDAEAMALATTDAAVEPAPEPAEEIPTAGGSYIREPDGTLTREKEA